MSRIFLYRLFADAVGLIPTSNAGFSKIKRNIVARGKRIISKAYPNTVIEIINKKNMCKYFFTLNLPDDFGYISVFFDSASYEEGTMSFIESFLTENDIVFDIGANIGFFTLRMASCLQTGLVYSFEPVNHIYDRLCTNIVINSSLKNIRLFNLAFSNTESNLDLHLFENLPHGHTSISNLGRTDFKIYKTKAISLDKFIRYSSIDKLDFINIDAEGAEKVILEGAINTITTLQPSLLIEANEETAKFNGFKTIELLVFLKKIGKYTFYRIPGANKRITPMKALNDYKHGDNIAAISSNHLNRLSKLL